LYYYILTQQILPFDVLLIDPNIIGFKQFI
jgi:hypothetical protein